MLASIARPAANARASIYCLAAISAAPPPIASGFNRTFLKERSSPAVQSHYLLTAVALSTVQQRPAQQFLQLIPGGILSQMGSSETIPLRGEGIALPAREYGDFDERPPRRRLHIEEFYMGTTEVTNAQYELFDPSHRLLRGFEHGYSVGDDEASFTSAI